MSADPVSDRDLSTLLFCAVRYALGRQTYIVGDVATLVERYADRLDENSRAAIERDIDRALAEGLAGDRGIDVSYWLRARNAVRDVSMREARS